MRTKTKIDYRKMMELAVEVMRKSVNEPRSDGKNSPLVGAVLVTPDGFVDTAYRGELRHGDHAEFTLLERKHRDERLDGSLLFATLEPCAPGARKHPKLGCAERIVNARIAEVWVGIEDPDPAVDRRGIGYLQDNGIKVHLFDLDLQKEIRQANERFIAQALERAAEARDGNAAERTPLSRWDEALPGIGLADLSPEALNAYRARTGTPRTLKSSLFMERLVRQGLLRRTGSNLVPTGFGFILFGKAPREVLHHAGVSATVNYPDGTHEIENFDGPAVLIPTEVEEWLRPKLASVIDRSRMVRTERPVFPFELVREAVVNALVHRDYDLVGATCHLSVTADTISVSSPGAPLPPVTVEQLQSFTAPMYNRNPKLQFALGGAKLLEGRGLGMRTFAATAQRHGLPLPSYSWDPPYLKLTFYRSAESSVADLDIAVLTQLTDAELKGWTFLATRTGTTQSEYAQHLGATSRTAQRHLGHFVQLGLLKRVGRGPATEYLKPEYAKP